MAIIHIVLFQFKDTATAEEIKDVRVTSSPFSSFSSSSGLQIFFSLFMKWSLIIEYISYEEFPRWSIACLPSRLLVYIQLPINLTSRLS